jgi:hypothetical protein
MAGLGIVIIVLVIAIGGSLVLFWLVEPEHDDRTITNRTAGDILPDRIPTTTTEISRYSSWHLSKALRAATADCTADAHAVA